MPKKKPSNKSNPKRPSKGPDIPNAAKMVAKDVADLTDRFIGFVSEFFEQGELLDILKKLPKRKPGDPPPEGRLSTTPEGIRKAMTNRFNARMQIQTYGEPLAEALERFGQDSSGVLAVVHCTGRGADARDPNYVVSKWVEIKVALRRAVFRLRNTQRDDKKESVPPTGVSHSSDFSTVNWCGNHYTFAKGQQRAVVEILWKEWEKGDHAVTSETIAEKLEEAGHRVGTSTFRLSHIFRHRAGDGYHPAWGKMIQSAGKGIFKLQLP